MPGYTYDTLIPAIANEMVVNPSGPEFQAQLPTLIIASEQRIYRDLQLLATVVRDNTGTLSSGSRDFALPSTNGLHFVTIIGLNVFTPTGTLETRNPLVMQSRDYVDFVWPSDLVGQAVPSMYAMITDQNLIVGPPPDQGYSVEVIGTVRPEQLSPSNQTTYLTLYLPDLMFAAMMVEASAYQKNFGKAADDPEMAVTWEKNYQSRFTSADGEEMRKRWGNTTWAEPPPGGKG